jgi:hypothetical protein
LIDARWLGDLRNIDEEAETDCGGARDSFRKKKKKKRAKPRA